MRTLRRDVEKAKVSKHEGRVLGREKPINSSKLCRRMAEGFKRTAASRRRRVVPGYTILRQEWSLHDVERESKASTPTVRKWMSLLINKKAKSVGIVGARAFFVLPPTSSRSKSQRRLVIWKFSAQPQKMKRNYDLERDIWNVGRNFSRRHAIISLF